jgi:hypothetical protein
MNMGREHQDTSADSKSEDDKQQELFDQAAREQGGRATSEHLHSKDSTLPSFIKRVIDAFDFITDESSEGTHRDIIQRHSKKIKRLNNTSIFIGAFTCAYIIAANSPDYSVINKIAELLGSIKSQHNIYPSEPSLIPPMFVKLGIKAAFATAIALMLWFQLRLANPFFQPERLRQLYRSSSEVFNGPFHHTSLKSLRSDARAYANSLPSMSLPKLCSTCSNTEDCSAKIINYDDFLKNHSFSLWKSLYENKAIEKEPLARLLSRAMQCRLVWNVKIVCANIALLGVASFFLHRAIEISSGIWVFPLIPILLTIGAFSLFFHLSQSNDSRDPQWPEGVWREHKAAGNEILQAVRINRSNYNDFYIEKICNSKNNTVTYENKPLESTSDAVTAESFEDKQIKVLARSARHIDHLIVDKLALLLAKKRNQADQYKNHQNTIIDALKNFLDETFPDARPFSIHMESELNAAWLKEEFFYAKFMAYVTKATKDKKGAIQHCCVSRDTSFCGPLLPNNCNSLLIARVDLSNESKAHLIRALDRLGISNNEFDSYSGDWIYIESGSANTFEQQNSVFSLTPIIPFINRLAFERYRDLLTNLEDSHEIQKPYSFRAKVPHSTKGKPTRGRR